MARINNYFSGRTSYVPYEKTVTVTENRASTDESLSLLNEIQEKAKERVHKIERIYLYGDYQDVNPTALSQGITFSLPEQIDGLDNIRTKNTKRELRFWEVVVEEKDQRFFAGFVLDVR